MSCERRWEQVQKTIFTRVADSSLLLAAVLVVPLGCVALPLDVNLYAVLTFNAVRLLRRPVLSILGHLLVSTVPKPRSAFFSNAYPVVPGVEREQVVEKVAFLLALHAGHAGEVLPAPLAGLWPPSVWAGAVVVGPCLSSSLAAKVCDEQR